MARATTITPVLRYQDAGAAARWLCEAFGFEEHDRAQELDGHVRFISLRLGDSFALVRPVANSVFDDLMVQPEAVGGANTQVCYLTVADTDGHRARAQAAGARIELEPQDDGLGGRFYTCRDLEGHLWSFGTRTYGLAHEAAGAFEPAELSASHPSTGIATPPGREVGKSGRSLRRSIGIAGATAVVAVGGWIFYGTLAGGPPGTIAAMSTATAARVEQAVEQLTQERNRRLAAEDAAMDAAKRLAEERAAATDARQALQRVHAELEQARQAKPAQDRTAAAADPQSALQRLQAELEDARRSQVEAWQALAFSKQLVDQHGLAKAGTEAELAGVREEAAQMRVRLAKQQQDSLTEKEQLQQVETALLAANGQIEELRAGLLEPMSPDSGEPVADNSPCVLAVQGKVPSAHKGPNTWVPANLGRLCRGAEASVEPARCFEELMRGKTNWGAGTTWMTPNALALCGGTRSARRTIDCFTKQIASSQTWQIAIKQCKNN